MDISRKWIITVGNTTNDVVNGIIIQGVILEELGGIMPIHVKCMCQTACIPEGIVFMVGADPLIILKSTVPNPGIAVLAMIEL